MSKWVKNSEEASIVLIGHLNPRIFHPEWLISKDIVSEWDYKTDDTITILPGLAKASLPGGSQLQVLPKQFSIHANKASEFSTTRDIVQNIFSLLSETPLHQVGLNYTSNVKINTPVDWSTFSTKIMPRDVWRTSIKNFDEIAKKNPNHLGLIDLCYQLPRPDNYEGYIRVQLLNRQESNQTLSILVNSHFELDPHDDGQLQRILNEQWESTINDAIEITNNIMNYELS